LKFPMVKLIQNRRFRTDSVISILSYSNKLAEHFLNILQHEEYFKENIKEIIKYLKEEEIDLSNVLNKIDNQKSENWKILKSISESMQSIPN
ncbi:MAG: hypothetical protein MHPSP_003285, partial [Paramarteilia canceri]